MQMNPIIQMLMNRLQVQNPKGYQTVNALMRNNANPQAIVQQMMSGTTPEQRQSILNQAKKYGAPDSILSQFQNMK